MGLGVGCGGRLRIRGGFVLSYRWYSLCVGLGYSDWRLFRANNAGPSLVLVLGIPHGGCFDLIYCRETTARP